MDEGGPEDEEFLPEHTIAMRAAQRYCKYLVLEHTKAQSIEEISSLPTIHIPGDVAKSALTLQEQRCKALAIFWERQAAIQANGKGEGHCWKDSESPITSIDVQASSYSPLQFRQHFQNGNIPAIIRGLDKESQSNFSKVCSKWCRPTSNKSTVDFAKDEIRSSVNRQWFRGNLGDDAIVPVRYQPPSRSVLDEEGRAEECETKEMSLAEWIGLLDKAERSGATTNDTSNGHHGEYYLKDWHLQSLLRELEKTNQVPYSEMQDLPLYQVPPHFEYDLLNAFLNRFTEKGDYMFTYWGPRGSRTTLHSDVMNSFSWSFNVAGTKQWTFYPPRPEEALEDNILSSSSAVTIIQHSGECIFVSSGWKHEVVNLEETLSINHNWITTANMDLTWECMCTEMKAIEVELKAWGVEVDCWDARESMLRGCVGLDVTAFFLMLLTRLLDLLLESQRGNEDDVWQLHFDLVRLKEGLLTLTYPEEDNLIHLADRLAAVFRSKESASEVIATASWAMDRISYSTC